MIAFFPLEGTANIINFAVLARVFSNFFSPKKQKCWQSTDNLFN